MKAWNFERKLTKLSKIKVVKVKYKAIKKYAQTHKCEDFCFILALDCEATKIKNEKKNKTSEMLQSGIPDFYIPSTAYHPVKNKDFSVATDLCDTKVKNCLLSNFIKVLNYLPIFRAVLPVLQVFFPFL